MSHLNMKIDTRHFVFPLSHQSVSHYICQSNRKSFSKVDKNDQPYLSKKETNIMASLTSELSVKSFLEFVYSKCDRSDLPTEEKQLPLISLSGIGLFVALCYFSENVSNVRALQIKN